MSECSNCHEPLGDGPKRAPVLADTGGDERDVFCARCFVWHRAPMEIGRYAAEHYAAVLCGACGWESVDVGLARCAQCRSTRIVTLPPPVLARGER